MSTQKPVAFLIVKDYLAHIADCPDFIDEYEYLKPLFKEQNVDLVLVDWQDARVNLSQFQFLIPKCVWNYMNCAQEFEAFLRRMILEKIPLKNSAQTVLWNMRKTYLLDLKQKGLEVGELEIIPQITSLSAEILESKISHWKQKFGSTMVAKPSIGGGAKDTQRFSTKEALGQLPLFQKILLEADLVLQPFHSEIAQLGEFSYFFFGGQFAHAIHKVPKSGDYRAHQRFGAVNLTDHPTEDEIAQAKRFLAATPDPLRYARVDCFKREGKLILVELELIEPYLYFERTTEQSAKLLVKSLLA